MPHLSSHFTLSIVLLWGHSWNSFLWGHHNGQNSPSVFTIPRLSAGPDIPVHHCLSEILSSLGFCDSEFSWFLPQVLKGSFKIIPLKWPWSIAASHRFTLVACKFLICSFPQSDRLSLNGHIHENGSEIYMLLLSYTLYFTRRHSYLDVFPPFQIQHVPNQLILFYQFYSFSAIPQPTLSSQFSGLKKSGYLSCFSLSFTPHIP